MSGQVQVCVVASFMYDLVATAPRLPAPGETLVGTGFATYVGGKGFNQSVAAVRAGASTAVVGRVGEDVFADEFRQFVHAEGIDARHLTTDAAHGTGVGLPIVEDGGQNAIIIVPRANEAVTPADIEAARTLIEGAGVVLLQLEIPIPAIRRAAQIAQGAGTTVILNPAPYVPLPSDLLACVDVLVPNEVELSQMVPQTPDRTEAALALHRSSGCVVVVTCGDQGLLVVDDRGQHRRIGAHDVPVTDTIGAGDAFCGNLGARLAVGDDLEVALHYANAAAALSVTRQGGAASVPAASETEAFVTDLDRGSAPVPLDRRAE